MDRKKCTKCGKVKPLDQFYRRATRPDGHESCCKACYEATWRPKQRKVWRCQAVRRYGLTQEAYDRQYAKQHGLCAMCEQPETMQTGETVWMLSVDHSHTTGKVRELLCNTCNRLLGLCGDDIQRLRQAIAYLRRHAKT